MKRRRADILAFFDHPGTSNDLTEHLKDTARGFRNIINHIARYLVPEEDVLEHPFRCCPCL